MINLERISPEIVSQLSDWEILSSLIFVNKVLEKETLQFQEEFYDMCFFFFDGDEDMTTNILKYVKQIYFNEYSKRHSN